MSSPVFEVRRDAGECGICATGFVRPQLAFFLTVKGNGAQAGAEQVEGGAKKDGARFVRVPDGTWRTQAAGTRFERKVKNWKWQENVGGVYVDVKLWENMVHASCAVAYGYVVPGVSTVALPGKRTEGHAHQTA